MIQSFLGGDQKTQATAKGSVAFQDGIRSAKQQQDSEVDADTEAGIPTNGTIPQTDYSISVLTEGKVTASPGTQEYKDQMNAHITETLQSNLGKFSFFQTLLLLLS